MLYPHLGRNAAGHLTIEGLDAVSLAREFGTPAYVMSENVVRTRCRTYLAAARQHFGADALPLFASKALSCVAIYQLMAEEGMGVDCVSAGELYTARAAGFPAGRIWFHGNNKTENDLLLALNMGVGTVVVDSREELAMLDALCRKRGVKQRILLRLSPGIDPHTHKAVITGNIDSKFGSAVATGAALAITKEALTKKNLFLAGFHCHIGSQIFESEPFCDAARIMLDFVAAVHTETGFLPEELNLGGGLGVPYTPYDPAVDYAAAVGEIAKAARAHAETLKLPLPRIILEPGRSLVADAGLTLYTVGSVKEIPGFRNYVSVDGGMPDNPRYALYQSHYTVTVANRAGEPRDYVATLAGRCCESGDLIGEGLPMEKPVAGDIMAVLTTGAYNFSMASNYNRVPRPPLVFVRDGKARVVVRRETFDDLIERDLPL